MKSHLLCLLVEMEHGEVALCEHSFEELLGVLLLFLLCLGHGELVSELLDAVIFVGLAIRPGVLFF